MQFRDAAVNRRVVSSALVLLVCAGAGVSAAADKPAQLKPGAPPLERSIKGGESHRYAIRLKAGQYCVIRVRQSAVDVIAVVVGPGGGPIAEVDTPRRTTGDEVIEVVATNNGMHTVTVRPIEDEAPKAAYEIRVEATRAATDGDRHRVAALRVFERAELLRREGTAESLPRALKDYEDALEHFAPDDDRNRGRAWLRIADVLSVQGYQNDAQEAYGKAAEALERGGDRAGQAEALSQGKQTQTDPAALAQLSGDKTVQALTLVRRSDRQYWGRDYVAAKANAEQAAALFRGLNNRWGLALALRTLGMVVQEETPQAAAPILREALALSERSGDLGLQSTILGNLAYANQGMGNLDDAIDFYTRGIALADRAGASIAVGWQLQGLGQIYTRLGRPVAGIPYYERALVRLRASGMRMDEAVTLESLGQAFSTMGDPMKGIEFGKQALAIFRSIGDRQEEAVQLGSLGVEYEAVGKSDEALEYFNSALRILQAVGNRRREGWTYGYLGAFYTSRGEYRDALQMHQKSLEASRAAADPTSEIRALARQADVYRLLGEPGRALERYEQALTIARTKKLTPDEVTLLVRLGYVFDDLGEYDRAGQCFSEALSRLREARLSLARAETSALAGLAALRRTAGDAAAALSGYREALEVARRGTERPQEVETLNGLGQTLVSAGDIPQALATFADALRLSREFRLRGPEAIALRNLMSGWRSQGRPQVAVFYGKQAVNMFQLVRANIAQLEPQTQRAYVRSKENAYRELADLLVSLGRLPEAQQVLDFLKEQEYRDYVRRAGEAAPREIELTPEESAWEERYRAIQDRVVILGRERSELTALRKRSAEEDARLAQLDTDMRVAAQAYQAFLASLATDFAVADAGERVFQLREAQALMSDLKDLGPGTVVLYTIVGAERYRVILITPDVQKAAEFPIAAVDLRRKIQAFRQALQNPETDPRPLAQELYTILVAPIARDLKQAGARTLMWALDDVLRYVPIAALHDGGAYLVERYQSVVFTPASRGNLKGRSPAWQAGLGVGVSKAQEGFLALPAVAEELRGIIRDDRVAQATSGVLRGHLLLDEAFTEPALRAELREHPAVVHVASHFQFRPGNEADSFLLLGDGRRLSVADLKTEWKFFEGVDLLTLSACDTATGTSGADGKEVESFGVLAQRNGAKTVIATLWPVADRSTRQLMEYFYRARTASGVVSKGEALRLAQLMLLRGMPAEARGSDRGLRPATGTRPTGAVPVGFSHPYYWAPFLLIGNWR